jgi:hypothetical protein
VKKGGKLGVLSFSIVNDAQNKEKQWDVSISSPIPRMNKKWTKIDSMWTNGELHWMILFALFSSSRQMRKV